MTQDYGAFNITLGSEVRTVDGEKLGEVKEVIGNTFKVSPGLLVQDYWLEKDCISTAGPTQLRLRISKDELDGHKRTIPDAA